MPLDPTTALATFAAIISLGFLGHLLFERTRFTDVFLLILFGFLIGPGFEILDVEGLKGASTLVGTLALIIILFDGGLSLNLRELVRGIARSTALAVLGFVLTVAAVAAVGHYGLGLAWPVAALLGTVLGGTSGVIVVPLLRHTSAAAGTRAMLTVESALTDVLCVIGTVTLLLVLGDGGSAAGEVAARGLAGQFAVAIVLGIAAGVLWLRLLKPLGERKYSYMVTLAMILALYSGTQWIHGSGPVAVLVFGVVLGNGFLILRRFRLEGVEFTDQQRQFQGEITFLVRVFFFVYLGVLLDPAALTSPWVLAQAAAVFAAILLARAVAVRAATWRDEETLPDRNLMALLPPRGLAAAVLAGLPAASGVPGTEQFLTIAFLVIVATNLAGTGAVVAYEVKKKRLWERIPVALPPRVRVRRAKR